METKVNTLMEKWIVVDLDSDNDPDSRFAVTKRSNFQEMRLCEAYEKNGIQLFCYDAGCYSLENSDSSIFEDFYNEVSEEFDINEDLLDSLELTYIGLCEMLKEPVGSVAYKVMKEAILAWDEVIEFFNKWIAENEYHTKVTGWTYHDSHNFNTVILKSEVCDPEVAELDDDEQEAILLQMPEVAPRIEGTNTSVETEDFIFYFDRWATNPWFCFVERQ